VNLRTPLCASVGVDLPVFQAPLGRASTPGLVAAVSGAGGLGMCAVTWMAEDDVRRTIREVRELTSAPFGVNVNLDWGMEANLDVALEESPPVMSLCWGDPAPFAERVRDAGARLFVTVGSAEEARRAEAAGADAVVAQGWEAGGHVCSQVSTLALVPAVADAVSIPVVAAGGIADGRGLAAVLALGAEAAWIGTRFLLAHEAPIHPVYRDLVVEAVETDTVYTTLFDGNWQDAPHRALRNSTVDLWERSGRPVAGLRLGEGDELARRADGSPIHRYDSAMPLETTTGEIEPLSLWAGQGVGLVRVSMGAAEIVRELVTDASCAIAAAGTGTFRRTLL
jgi:NAD(P)H-dependent flavin oxidoreductase YrpB (nitropropane dioxygenase family)